MPCAADTLAPGEIDSLAGVKVCDLPLPSPLRHALMAAEVGDLAGLAMRESAEIAALCGGSPGQIDLLASLLREHLSPADPIQAVLDRIAGTGWTGRMVASHTRLWQHFARWCQETGQAALPASPETVAHFLASREGLSRESRRLTVQTVVAVHRLHDRPFDKRDPAIVQAIAAGPANPDRAIRTARVRAFTGEDLARILPAPVDELRDLRDRAVFALGYAAGLTGGELADLTVASLAFHGRGLTLTTPVLRRGYTWHSHVYEIPATEDALCPVAVTRAWIEAAGVATGPLFYAVSGDRLGKPATAGTISAILRARVAAAGLDPAALTGLSFRRAWQARTERSVEHRAIPGQAPHQRPSISPRR